MADLSTEPVPPTAGFVANVPAELHGVIAAQLIASSAYGLCSGFGPDDADEVAAGYAARRLRERRRVSAAGWSVLVIRQDYNTLALAAAARGTSARHGRDDRNEGTGMADYMKFRWTTAKVGASMALLALIAGVAEKARGAAGNRAGDAGSAVPQAEWSRQDD